MNKLCFLSLAQSCQYGPLILVSSPGLLKSLLISNVDFGLLVKPLKWIWYRKCHISLSLTANLNMHMRRTFTLETSVGLEARRQKKRQTLAFIAAHRQQ